VLRGGALAFAGYRGNHASLGGAHADGPARGTPAGDGTHPPPGDARRVECDETVAISA